MLEPALVAECVAAMRARSRAGDREDAHRGRQGAGRARRTAPSRSFDGGGLRGAAAVSSRGVREAGCQVAIVHARKAVLGGLSPKDNREVPPLRYDVVRG